MPIVSEYWAGVLQRLQAEVSVFAALVAHEGERGRENEAVLARILDGFVPLRYGIGSGLLVDTEDHYSRQTDIVLFDQSDEPRLFAQTTQLLFPIESVLASIEIKTTLRGGDIEDCFAKAKDMRELVTARRHPNGASHPLFVVLAYRAGQEPATIMRKLLAADPEQRPDLLCVVEQGILAGTSDAINAGGVEDYNAGTALLRDTSGNYIDIEPSDPNALGVFDGRQYPIVKYDDRLVLSDPARGLLLFVEALVRLVAIQQARPIPVISHYVQDAMRELAWAQLD